jgi:hypothetical protein
VSDTAAPIKEPLNNSSRKRRTDSSAPRAIITWAAFSYSRELIEIADEGVANVWVSIAYPGDRIEEMVAALLRSLSLEIERREPGALC